ncbi:MAG: acetoacetate decarboxylase [Halioglobus sp.]|jgi:acetoacetate decarboxylase
MSKYNFRGTNFGVDRPPYPVPPYQYRNNEMFTLKVETQADYLRALVPEPMQPNAENILVIYIGSMNVTEPSTVSYGEAGMMVPVTLGERAGTYLPVLYLNEVQLLTSGREVWGFPKFEGQVYFEKSNEGVEARVREGDVDIMHMQMNFETAGEPIPIYDREHFLLKSIPSVDGKGHDIRQINSCRVRNDQRKEIWEGRADLTLRSTAASPLGDIPIKQIVSSVYTVGDIILDTGEMVHDYLAPDA